MVLRGSAGGGQWRRAAAAAAAAAVTRALLLNWGLGSSGGDDVGGKCWYEPVHLSEVRVQGRPGAHVAEPARGLKISHIGII